MLIFVAAPAAAAEIGTCLTEAGLRLAPWTDAVDPACGEDCGREEADETLCSTDTGACRLDGQLIAQLVMPAPSGPRCIEPGPECSPDRSTAGGVPGAVAALVPPLPTALRRIQGTLPGAGPPSTNACPLDRDIPPDLRPPIAPA